MNRVLPRPFYLQDVHTVARELPGKLLVRILEDGTRLSGRIVETEAYGGSEDPASHAFRGKTPRNAVMFGPPGRLYVYFTYGMHYCCNVVTGEEGRGEAVLIRALEPIEGLDIMKHHRFGRDNTGPEHFARLTNGPAKLCRALDIGRAQNGIDLCSGPVFIENAPGGLPGKLRCSGRIGIRSAADYPWRYYAQGNPWVSKSGRKDKHGK